MEFDFDAETGLRIVGDGVFDATLWRSWWVHRGPNGGYLAALALRAIEAVVGDPERAARSLTVHFASPPRDGTLRITVTRERVGRSLTSCSARLEQDGTLVGLALAAFSRPRPGPEFCDRRMPAVLPPGADPVVSGDAGAPAHLSVPPIARRWETRWALGPAPGQSGASEARTGGWIRLPEQRTIDAAVLAAMTDAWIPAVFARLDTPVLVPTVDLTVHFRSTVPPPGARPDDWVLAVFRTDVAADGFLEEDGELWSADGVLLAQSRQLAAMFPMPG